MPIDSKLLADGIQHHRSGDLQQAHEIYRQLLAADPQNAVIFNLLAAVCIDANQLSAAGAYLAEALRLNPALAAAHDNSGLLLVAQNRSVDAVAHFRRAAALDPRNVQTLWNLANSLLLSEQISEAIESLRQVVRLAPHDVRAQFELAKSLARAGRNAESIAAYQATIRLKPDLAEACVNLANLYIGEALFDEAVRWSRRAVDLRPQFAEAYHNLGCALTKQEKYDEAIEALQTAVSLKPEMSEAYNNLGVALVEGGKVEAAIEHYRRALAARSADPEALYNLGNVYLKAGDVKTALDLYDRAIALRPEYAEARHNRLATWLLQGRFAEAFPEYELRFRSRDQSLSRWPWKLWNGEPLAGRSIVLCPEPGFGDTLQFVRYAPLVKEQGARVLVVCNVAQKPILARTPGIDALITPDAKVEADFCVPMMSLPHRMQTKLESIPVNIPYVFAEPRLVAAWQQRLAEWEGFKVGIVWQGNPQFPDDRRRSIPLAHFGPLVNVPGVRLFNLQKGPGVEQLQDLSDPSSIVDFGDEVDQSAGAFMDTAAIMKNLDLVITSDTAAAHLAGALGVNVWVALQMVPDWRWLLERGDCPWYPSMRLFRQSRLGDWSGVFEQIASELERFVAHNSAS
jgi:tetratricopeptide (TPR) repeat protein